MQFIDYSFNSPQETISRDEELLRKAEDGRRGETLRFWESKEYFVVIGRAGKTEDECILDKCRSNGIKIIRRISGGGTVLQGPGCLNYSLILSYDRDERLRNINTSYESILKTVTDTISTSGVENFHPRSGNGVGGISDLVYNGKKFSGNAQARKKKYFLHHGTILYNFDIDKVSKYLKHPPKEPKYRQKRTHKDFLTNIPIDPEKFKKAIKRNFL